MPARKKAAIRRPRRTALERIRELVDAWPETDERISHGAPTWWGGRKTFATLHENHHGDGRLAVWIKSDLDTREALIEADPERFFVPPYVGPSGWIGVDLGTRGRRRIDWKMVEGLLEAGYRQVAPKRAVAALDARR